MGVDISQVHYRPITKILTNISFHGYQGVYFTPALFAGSLLDTIQINSLSMKDSFLLSDGIKVSRFKKLIFGSMEHSQSVFENIGAFTDNFLSIFQNGHVEVNNFRVHNITGPFSRSLFFCYLNSLPNAPTKIRNVNISGYNFLNGGLITTVDDLERIEVSNVTIQDSFTNPRIPIFEVSIIQSFQFGDVKVSNVQAIDQSDEESTVFRVNELDLQSNANSSFDNINVSNCGISLIQFGSLVNNSSETSQLELNGVAIQDSIYTSSRSIISTEKLENYANFLFKISGFSSLNVTFVKDGDLLLFSHALVHSVVVQDSIFNSLQSAAISVESSGLTGNLANEVSFQNCTFKEIHSSSQSLIKVSEQSIVNFLRSKFDSVSISFDRSGLIEASSESMIKFTETNFTNNAAVTSTLFTLSSGAYVECNS